MVRTGSVLEVVLALWLRLGAQLRMVSRRKRLDGAKGAFWVGEEGE